MEVHRANLTHDLLISASEEGFPLTLTLEIVDAIVDRWQELIEAKNQVVLENHELARRLMSLPPKESS